jgi:hypothetical protein
MLPMTQPVAARTFASPWSGRLAGADLGEVVAAGLELLAEEPRTRAQLGALLAPRWPDADPAALAQAVTFHAALVQVPPRGLWGRTGRATNTTLEAWVGRPLDKRPRVEDLVLRYLAVFGPATVADMRVWSWLTGLREVVEGLGPLLRTYRDEAGRELFDVADGPIADPDLPAPVRFLPQYDNLFLSHEDRSRINGELSWGIEFGWKGPILVDGGIAAAWRVRRAGKAATMTVELGRRLTPTERLELEEEATRLAAFLDPTGSRELVIVEGD